MTASQPSSRDISHKLVALIFGANFFGSLIIFLYFSVIDSLSVGGVAVRSLERRHRDLRDRRCRDICRCFCDNQLARLTFPSASG